MIAAASDFRTAGFRATPFYGASKEKQEDYIKNVQGLHLKNFERLLGDSDYFVANKISVADLTIYDVFTHQCLGLIPGCLAAYPKLDAFVKRIDALPNITAYKASDAFKQIGNAHKDITK